MSDETPYSEVLRRVLARDPAQGEARLLRLKEQLGLPDQDSLFLVLLALEEYLGLMGRIPEDIRRAASEIRFAALQATSNAVQDATQESLEANSAKILEALRKEVAKEIRNIRSEASRAGYSRIPPVLLSCLLLAAFFAAGFLVAAYAAPLTRALIPLLPGALAAWQ